MGLTKLTDNYRTTAITTFTKKLSHEEIQHMLKFYKHVDDITTIQVGMLIRYFKIIDENTLQFCVGGTVLLNDNGKYIRLMNNRLVWHVQLDTAILYMKRNPEEIKQYYQNIIDQQNKNIEELKEILYKQRTTPNIIPIFEDMRHIDDVEIHQMNKYFDLECYHIKSKKMYTYEKIKSIIHKDILVKLFVKKNKEKFELNLNEYIFYRKTNLKITKKDLKYVLDKKINQSKY
jgi:hypothetical protein